jgi:hypothetical protein
MDPNWIIAGAALIQVFFAFVLAIATVWYAILSRRSASAAMLLAEDTKVEREKERLKSKIVWVLLNTDGDKTAKEIADDLNCEVAEVNLILPDIIYPIGPVIRDSREINGESNFRIPRKN